MSVTKGDVDLLSNQLLVKSLVRQGAGDRCAGGRQIRFRHAVRIARGRTLLDKHEATAVIGQKVHDEKLPVAPDIASAALFSMRNGESAVFTIDARLSQGSDLLARCAQDGYEWIADSYEWEVEILAFGVSVITPDSRLVLQRGVCMPRIGLGLYTMSPDDAYRSTLDALQMGYRLIDTASMYRNEAAAGEAIRASGIPRSEITVVSKINNPDHGYQRTLKAFEKSLKNLGLDQVDVMLIHSPLGGLLLETWDALLEIQRRGLARQVGVSNFGIQHLQRLEAAGRPMPSVNQFELSPFCQELELRRFCAERGIVVMGYSPLTRGERLKDRRVVEIAAKHKRSAAQVLIRWALQQDVVSIPKSTRKQRLAENLDIFGFELDSDDLGKLASCEEDLHTCWDCLDEPWQG